MATQLHSLFAMHDPGPRSMHYNLLEIIHVTFALCHIGPTSPIYQFYFDKMRFVVFILTQIINNKSLVLGSGGGGRPIITRLSK